MMKNDGPYTIEIEFPRFDTDFSAYLKLKEEAEAEKFDTFSEAVEAWEGRPGYVTIYDRFGDIVMNSQSLLDTSKVERIKEERGL